MTYTLTSQTFIDICQQKHQQQQSIKYVEPQSINFYSSLRTTAVGDAITSKARLTSAVKPPNSIPTYCITVTAGII